MGMKFTAMLRVEFEMEDRAPENLAEMRLGTQWAIPKRDLLMLGRKRCLEKKMRANFVIITKRAALFCIAVAAALLSAETSKAQSNLPVCPLIATGGTIAMKIDPIKQAP